MAADREESENNQVEDRHSGDTWVIKWTIYNKLSGPLAEKDVKKVKMIQILLFVCFLIHGLTMSQESKHRTARCTE